MDGGGRRGQCRPVQGYWLVEGTWVQGGGYAGWWPRATTICGRCGRWRRRLLESARAVAWQGVSFTRGGGVVWLCVSCSHLVPSPSGENGGSTFPKAEI